MTKIIKNKSVKEQIKEYRKQILELKKQKLLKVLQKFISQQKLKEEGSIVLPNPNNKYRSIYLSYLYWKKKYPKKLPSLREIWSQED